MRHPTRAILRKYLSQAKLIISLGALSSSILPRQNSFAVCRAIIDSCLFDSQRQRQVVRGNQSPF